MGQLVVNPTADSFIREQSPTTNFGATSPLSITGFGGFPDRTLLEFDVSSIPASATIDSAELKMRGDPIASGIFGIAVDRVTKAWVEAEVTWGEYSSGNAWGLPGGDYDATDEVTASWDRATTPDTIDITALVQDALDNRAGTLSLIVRATDSNFGSAYDSREAALPPVLTVSYSGTGGPATDDVAFIA